MTFPAEWVNRTSGEVLVQASIIRGLQLSPPQPLSECLRNLPALPAASHSQLVEEGLRFSSALSSARHKQSLLENHASSFRKRHFNVPPLSS